MRTGNELWLAGLVVSLAASGAFASPAASPAPVSVQGSNGQFLTRSQIGVGGSASAVQEYEFLDGGRSVVWARITRELPSTQRNGELCPFLVMSYLFMNTTDTPQNFTFAATGPLLPMIPNASVKFMGDIKLTDNGNSGASLSGNGVGGAAYLAAVNGAPGAVGTIVSSQFTSPLFADDGEMVTDSFDLDCFSVGDITQLGARISFEISENASASGSLRLEVCCNAIPLPTSGAMGLAGLITLGSIRRRRA